MICMTADQYTTKNLLALRKLTRAVAELLRGQLKEYLGTLSPLIRPKAVLGDFVEGPRETYKPPSAAFQDFQNLYAALAKQKPFNLPTELTSPLEVASNTPEITLLEYAHTVKTDAVTKNVVVTSPLKWILSYAGFAPKRLRELFAGKPVGNEIQEFVLHTLMMHIVMTRQTGLVKILEALHFTVSSGRLPGFGELPITFLASTIGTVRPPDNVIIESTEISGTDAFEEIVDPDQLTALQDPFKERLLELTKQYSASS